MIHYLHIGKNAGTQLRRVAKQVNRLSDKKRIMSHAHDVQLSDLPEDISYFFSVRDPLTRFRSGFYSRKRGGRRGDRELSEHEQKTFATFEHANDLAEALFEPGPIGETAAASMNSIRHTAQKQLSWFVGRGQFLTLHPPLAIIRVESLEQDLRAFLRAADLGVTLEQLELTTDRVKGHRFDYDGIPPLSDKAIANLKLWYRDDIEFYTHCTRWIEAQNANDPTGGNAIAPEGS